MSQYHEAEARRASVALGRALVGLAGTVSALARFDQGLDDL